MAVQSVKPVRRILEERPNYKDFRGELREDFNGCCGYCDDSDEFVDRSCFHIDHFAPQKPFKHLEKQYGNLVYSCRFCNNRKRNHWVGDDPTVPNDGSRGFVDPCDDQYEQHLERLDTGAIVGTSDLGSYMVQRLNLGLLRHQVLWNARRSRKLRSEILELINRFRDAGSPMPEELLSLALRYVDLNEEIESYELLAISA